MIMDNPGAAFFQVVVEEEFALYFTIPNPEDPDGPRWSLMRIRCFEEPKLLGAIAWLGERQHLWPDWRRIAEATDGATLAAHLVEIGKDAAFKQFGSTDYLYESFEGARVVVLEDGVTAEVIAKLATRDLPIIRHTFPSTGHLIMFLLWLDEGGRDATSVDLALRALLEGRDALARLLTGIAVGLSEGAPPPGR